MNLYRIWFHDYTSLNYLETQDPLRAQEYRARNRADALRQWLSEFYGWTPERVERIESCTA